VYDIEENLRIDGEDSREGGLVVVMMRAPGGHRL